MGAAPQARYPPQHCRLGNMTPSIVTLQKGTLPLVISIPHGGEYLPDSLARLMTPAARTLADTDWHLARLYGFAAEMGASIVRANYSRYVIDVNRPSDGGALYPGQTTTSLCPITSFRGEALYAKPQDQPGPEETSRRVQDYWQPYHDALTSELARVRALHENVLLWEAHSIASVLPYLFEGRLPDLNIGTFSGAACAPSLKQAVVRAAKVSTFSWVADERFKGGHITRQYGRPDSGVHVVQLEMAQSLYMDESLPFSYREDLACKVIPTLQTMVSDALHAMSELR